MDDIAPTFWTTRTITAAVCALASSALMVWQAFGA